MRRNPTKWTVRALQMLALLLVIAFGAHEIWLLLKPLVSALISLIILIVIIKIIRRGW